MLVVGAKIWGNVVTVTELFGMLILFDTLTDSLDNPISGIKLDVSMINCNDISVYFSQLKINYQSMFWS